MDGLNSILLAGEQFLSTFISLFQSNLGNEFSFVQNLFTMFLLSWGRSFSPYGIFIPALMVASVGLSLFGAYLVFTFMAPLDVVAGDV